METSFTELRNKEVINVLSGRLLGHVCDVILDLRRNCILGFVVPGCKSFFNVFKHNQEIFIPLSCICKVGEDVILVEIIENSHKKPKKNVRIFNNNNKENVEEKQNSQNNLYDDY